MPLSADLIIMNEQDSNDLIEDSEEKLISKSQLKRDAHALLDLGKDIVALQSAHLKKIPLDEDLLEAINEARKIKAQIALKRQLHYIAKILRHRDVEDIQSAMDAIRQQSSKTDTALKTCEKWRERLLGNESGALEAFISQYPDVERQKIRQMIRNAQKEATNNKPPKWSRELFRYIRSITEQ